MSGVSRSRKPGAPARSKSHAVPRLTPAERAARGKAERAGVPRSFHADYLGKGTAFDQAMASFAASYADQNERDYRALKEAAASGRISAHLGI